MCIVFACLHWHCNCRRAECCQTASYILSPWIKHKLKDLDIFHIFSSALTFSKCWTLNASIGMLLREGWTKSECFQNTLYFSFLWIKPKKILNQRHRYISLHSKISFYDKSNLACILKGGRRACVCPCWVSLHWDTANIPTFET